MKLQINNYFYGKLIKELFIRGEKYAYWFRL